MRKMLKSLPPMQWAVLAIVFAILLVPQLALAGPSGHTGPKYEAVPSVCKIDYTSATTDHSDGNRVVWTDAFNRRHEIVLTTPGSACTVLFPVNYGTGDWYWHDDDRERTGMNRSTSWISATFTYDGGDLVISSVGYTFGDYAPGKFSEAIRSLGEHIKDINKVVEAGGTTLESAMKIAGPAGLIKVPLKK